MNDFTKKELDIILKLLRRNSFVINKDNEAEYFDVIKKIENMIEYDVTANCFRCSSKEINYINIAIGNKVFYLCYDCMGIANRWLFKSLKSYRYKIINSRKNKTGE